MDSDCMQGLMNEQMNETLEVKKNKGIGRASDGKIAV